MFTDAAAYDRFMGRFSSRLAVAFADFARADPPARIIDVGCGPGALTAVLASRLGEEAVTAIDPSEPFVAAVRERLPRVTVRQGSAEQLPFPDAAFDAALSQLVVHFMSDPVRGTREMTCVTRPGGTVAACVWDTENGRAPHAIFLRTVTEVTGAAPSPPQTGTRKGDIVRLLHEAGCREVAETELTVASDFATFEEWWEVHTLRVGPSAVLDTLTPEQVAEVRRRTHEVIGDDSVTIEATAWAARGTVPTAFG
jgi:ubiquinone/menaquinone biosynthesis C-methylase UbiE